MARNKSKTELEAELRAMRKHSRSEVLLVSVPIAIKWLGLSFIAYCGYLCFATLSGKATSANILVNVLGDIRVTYAVSWLFGISGLGYGAVQARLRKQTEARLGGRVKELEEQIDPKRSSSR